MKNKIYYFLVLIFLPICLKAQVTQLNRLGQTPGGGCFHVNYDNLGKRLFVGCGASIWIYDCSDTNNIHVIAKRPLLGIVNETDLYGNTLFVAASHDGVYALDINSPSLNIIAHYTMTGDHAAYDLWRTNDTLYIADGVNVLELKYSANSFSLITTFGVPNAWCVARRGNYIVVGSQQDLLNVGIGKINVYSINNLNTPVSTWTSHNIFAVQDIQFADLRDDIIYICGGPDDIFLSESKFYALQFSGNTLAPVDSLTICTPGNLPLTGIANQNIMNMDSRNDTLFLVTTAAVDSVLFPVPHTYMPIIDATGLPVDTMKKIGRVIPGLWHFDAALMNGTPYIAMSSEWLGVLISNISQLQPFDTLGFYETGGWCTGSRIRHDTLWVANEGYGLVAYKLDSLYYSSGYMANSKILHIFTQFVNDFDFLNDSLVLLGSSEIYNLAPWYNGGSPIKTNDLGYAYIGKVSCTQTNTGERVIISWDSPLDTTKEILLLDPFCGVTPAPKLDSIIIQTNISGMLVSHDTLFCGQKFGTSFYLAAYKITNDKFVLIDTINTYQNAEIITLAKENNIIVASQGVWRFSWYRISGGIFTQLGAKFDWGQIASVVYLKNNLIYVGEKLRGLKVYSIANPAVATLVAECPLKGGWGGLYGSTNVDVGYDGKIYVSDYHAGVIIIEAYDTTFTGNKELQRIAADKTINIYPNPSKNYFMLRTEGLKMVNASLKIYNITGKEIMSMQLEKSSETKVYTSDLARGLYFLIITDNNKTIASKKFIVQ